MIFNYYLSNNRYSRFNKSKVFHEHINYRCVQEYLLVLCHVFKTFEVQCSVGQSVADHLALIATYLQ